MADNLDQTGVIQVDGAWVTSVKYSAEALGPDTGSIDLRFLQGRAEVARIAISRERLSELLGELNRNAVERHIANDADKYLAVVAGELRGRQLHYQKVTLANAEPNPPENSIGATPSHERSASTQNQATRDAQKASDHQDAGAAPNPEVPDDGATQAREGQASTPAPARVPAHIAAKYLVKGNTYHFDDQTVAFIDKGNSLTVQTHNKAIIQDLIAIAQAREWQVVSLSGTQAFRREAWSAATAAGLTVSGYTPSAIERAAAERARSRREAPTSPGVTPREPGAASTGDPISRVSEKTAVSVMKEGSNAPGGKSLTPEQEVAAAIRSATITREELQLKYPELNKAVFQHLASHDQFAEAYIKSGLIRESDRAQVIAQMRDRLAGKLEQGALIREPDDKEVNTLIRRSVNRVAADIGRPPVEIQPRAPEAPARSAATREDVQVRA
jgi:conjugative element/phage-associated large polyvalent protein